MSTLKRQNDDLLMNTVQLEGQLTKSKQKIFGTEEQLRKLEHKVSISDVNVANQVRPVSWKEIQDGSQPLFPIWPKSIACP